MPLSEREKLLLAELEKGLYSSEADLVAPAGAAREKPSYRSRVLGVLVGVLGVALLVTGAATQLLLVGVLGFAVMLTGVLLLLGSELRIGKKKVAAGGATNVKRRGGAARATLGDKMEQRWERRMGGEV